MDNVMYQMYYQSTMNDEVPCDNIFEQLMTIINS